MKNIYSGNERMVLHDNGNISRPKIGMNVPSGQWKAIGAFRFNNFGHVVEIIPLETILSDKQLQWFFKNGKQRLHLVDLDHGTRRVWMSPKHYVD